MMGFATRVSYGAGAPTDCMTYAGAGTAPRMRHMEANTFGTSNTPMDRSSDTTGS
jgi:hypothetical protein